MTYRTFRWLKKATLVLSTGLVFGTLSCVQNAADLVGTGISLTSMLAPGGNVLNPFGVGLDFLADLLRFAS